MKRQTATAFLWLIAIFFVALNLRPAITSIGPLTTTLLHDLQSTNTQISVLTSVPVFCMGLFASLAIPLKQKLGLHRTMRMMLLLLVIAFLCRLVWPSYTSLVITSLLAGFAIAVIGPLINTFIKTTFPSHTASALGVYSFGIGAGATLSASFTYVLYVKTTWEAALACWGLFAVLAYIIWTVTATKQTQTSCNEQTVTHKGRNPWRSKRAWLILLFFGMQTALFFTLMAFLSPLVQAKGFTEAGAGQVLMVFALVQMLGNLAIPLLLERFPHRIMWLFTLTTLVGIGLIGLYLGQGVMIWSSVIVIALALSGMFPIGLLLPLDEARNEDEANRWSSMVLSGGFMLSAILPLCIGVMMDYTKNYTYVIFLLFVLVVLILCILLQLQRTKSRM